MCQNTNGPFSPLEKTRWVIKDSAVWSGLKWAVDWTPMDESILDTRAYTTTSAYDALNRVRILTYPEDANSQRQELSPRYNRAGALVRIDLQGAPVLEHLAYNAKGQRILVARPNGFHTRYAYDPITFRLQRIRTERFSQSGNTYTPLSGNVRQDTGYEYDLGGNIIKVKERVADCGINGSLLGSDALDKAFEYDPLKRLLKATGREGGGKWNGDHWRPVNAGTASPNANNVRAYTRRYSYDKVGNVQDLVHQAISNNYTRHYNYLSGKNHLASIDSGGSPPSVNASFLYDLNGNWVKTDTTRYYGWNAGDEMAFYKLQVSGSAVSMQSHHFYSGGQRVKKLIRNGTGDILEATVYIDGIFEHRYNTNQQQTSLLVMDGRSKIATVRIGDPMDGNIPAFTYQLEDHLGSQVARLDDTGAPVDRDEYYPFGEYSLRQTGMARYGYVGKEYDFETGFHYYGARYYAAWTCRFVSVDPLAHDYPHYTPYQYAGNKPINFVDLDGLEEFDLSKIRTDYPTVQAPSLEAFILGKREGTYAVSQTKTPSFGIHPQLGRVEWWFHSDFTDGSRPKGAWMWRTVDPPTRMEPRPITLLPPPLPPSELKLPPPLPPPPIRIAPRPTVTGRVQQDPIAAPVPAAGEPMAPSDGDGQALPARQPMTSPPPPNVGWFFGGPGIAAFRKQPGFDRDMANLAQWLIDNPDYNITIEAGGGSFPWNDWDSTIGLSSTTYGERVDNMNAIRRAALQNVLDQNGINVDNRVTFKRGEVNKAPVTISVDP